MAGKQLAVTWSGLDRFMDELHLLPRELLQEANGIMQTSAAAAKTDIAAAYPVVTGNLRAGLKIRPAPGGIELVQTAPHGFIYERGTKIRENKAGANRGQMRANPTFLPIAVRYQREAISAVIDRLYQHGAASVTGAAEEE